MRQNTETVSQTNSLLLLYIFSFNPEKKRKTYDQLGEEGLKGHMGDGGSYTFTGDPREIFAQLFGAGGYPSEDMIGGGMNSFGMGGQQDHNEQDPPIEHTMNLTLEELYTGCTKKMKISRNVMIHGNQFTKEDKVVTIDVKPGWKAGTKITFPKEGDQLPGKIPSDVVFVIGEKEHELLERDGNDLKYKVRITLKNALCGRYKVVIPTIEGERIEKTIEKIIDPQTVDIVEGHGMPISKYPSRRGDLLIGYDIMFPSIISGPDQQKLAKILST